MAYIDDLVSAVNGVTKNFQERAVLLFACGAESNCQPIQNAQGAPAYGPWQIYLPYHNEVTVAQANDPKFAANYMYTHMSVASCTASQDWSNANAALLNAARCVEHASPQETYSAAQIAQADAIVQKYASPTFDFGGNPVDAIKNLPGQIAGIPGAVASAVSGGIGDALSGAVGAAFGVVKKILATDLVERAALILVGFAMLFIGLSSLARNSGAGQAAAGAATTAAAAA